MSQLVVYHKEIEGVRAEDVNLAALSSTVHVTSPYERTIFEQDVKQRALIKEHGLR